MAKNTKKLRLGITLNEEAIERFAAMFSNKEAPELRKINIERPSIRETKSTPNSPILNKPIETSIFSKNSLDAISKNGDDSNLSFEIKHKIKEIASGKHKNKETKSYEENNYSHYDTTNETGIIISVEKAKSDEMKSLGFDYLEENKHIDNLDNVS